ncbi:lysophospholipid acyltransferase family protein [Treponema zioleckii]|uniref:lysophospholipid acyltransferase family protein n=1 Tax=Treponema zioleckii TaxID=331680 RepID=UPI00168AAE79|nr:lysophospholipid acyltransferase family protein [Treponema zioleckii]
MNRTHLVNPNVYIPEPLESYPENPTQRLVPVVKISDIRVDEHYPFLMESFKEKFFHHLTYLAIFTFVFPLHILRYGLKIEGRKNLRKHKKLFKNGAMTVCNHVYRWDFLAVLQAIRYHKLWYPTFSDNVTGKDMLNIRSTGGIPIPETGFAAVIHFNQAFDELHRKKEWLHVFPESCRWDWYEPIRPFNKGAFEMAYRYNLPVIPLVIHYRPLTGWRKLFKIKHPLVTISIGEPILPNKENGRKTEARRMCEQAHAEMCKMAGITQNGWNAVNEPK